MNKDYTIEEDSTEFTNSENKYIELNKTEFFIFGRQNCFIHKTYKDLDNSEDLISSFNYINKEKFYLRAINNLLRQKEYINLMFMYETKQIDADDLSKELEENEHKYLIKIDTKLNSDNFKVISNIIKNIDFEFDEDDVAEIFSIKTNFFNKMIKTESEER